MVYPAMSKATRISAKTARIGLFSATALAGSFITLPSPIPSVALDSASGYFCSLYYGPQEGFYVFALGHTLTATLHGFPLGPLHLPVALGMGAQGALMGKTKGALGPFAATVLGITFNTLLAFVAFPVYGLAFVASLLPYLAFASSTNAALAYAAYTLVAKRGKRRENPNRPDIRLKKLKPTIQGVDRTLSRTDVEGGHA